MNTIRWLPFAFLAAGLLIVQMTVGRLLGIGPQRITPDLFIIVAVFLALRSSCSYVLIACWLLGLAKDLSGAAVLGSYAISFGLIGYLVMTWREWLYVENPLTILLVAAVGSIAAEHVAWLINVLRGNLPPDYSTALELEILFSALFTAALAPYGQVLLLKLGRHMGVDRKRLPAH